MGTNDPSNHPDHSSPQESTERTLTSGTSGIADAGQIGPYRLLQLIGEGGMGEVWLAEQKEPIHRTVALKLIKAGMDTKAVVARFESERQALALMDHPNIARVYDAGSTAEGRPYFVMEYVPGLPITEYCDKHRLTIKERLELFMQVCDGVQHAHQKAIIHRDLKPSNVLVVEQDNKAVPKIIDFGLAKATAQRLTDKTFFTELGVMMGTPEYMSPEQADLREQNIDTRTDVYSLGVILYELLVGALPFEAKALRAAGMEGILRVIREQEPAKPSTKIRSMGDVSSASAEKRREEPRSFARHLQGELDWITMKALEKDRVRRYGSASEFGADISRYLRKEPVVAGPATAGYRIRKYAARHRIALGAAAGLMVLLAGFVVTQAVELHRIKLERDRATRERDRANRILHYAENSVDSMLQTVDGPLRLGETPAVAGLEDIRKQSLKSAIKFYSDLGTQNADAESVRNGTAIGSLESGRLNLRLHRYPQAIDDCQQAIKSFGELANQYASEPVYRERLASSANLLGETYRMSGTDPSGAEKAYGHALGIEQKLLKSDPKRQSYAQDLAQTYYNRGIFLDRQKKVDASKDDFTSAIHLLEPLAAQSQQSDAAWDLARAYNNRAYLLYYDENQLSAAKVDFDRATSLGEGLINRGAGTPDYQLELAEYYDGLAAMLAYAGNVQEAQKAADRAQQLIAGLSTPTPSVTLEQANVYMIRGAISESGDPLGAANEYQKSMEVLEGMKKAGDPQQLDSNFNLRVLNLAQAYLSLAENRWNAKAVAEAKNAIEHVQHLLPDLAESDRIEVSKSLADLQEKMYRQHPIKN